MTKDEEGLQTGNLLLYGGRKIGLESVREHDLFRHSLQVDLGTSVVHEFSAACQCQKATTVRGSRL
jgi:hypothetical protein